VLERRNDGLSGHCCLEPDFRPSAANQHCHPAVIDNWRKGPEWRFKSRVRSFAPNWARMPDGSEESWTCEIFPCSQSKHKSRTNCWGRTAGWNWARAENLYRLHSRNQNESERITEWETPRVL
jgi:hypothetical protein